MGSILINKIETAAREAGSRNLKIVGLSQDLLKDRKTLREAVSKSPVEGPA
jgi:hypothetical protein